MATNEGRIFIINGLGEFQEVVNPQGLVNNNHFSVKGSSLNDDGTLFIADNEGGFTNNNEELYVIKTIDGSVLYTIPQQSHNGYMNTSWDICGTGTDGYFIFTVMNNTDIGSGLPGSGSGDPIELVNDEIRVHKISDGLEICRFSLPIDYVWNENSQISIQGTEATGATIVISFPYSFSPGADGTGDTTSEGEGFILCMSPAGVVDTTIMANVTSSEVGRGGGGS